MLRHAWLGFGLDFRSCTGHGPVANHAREIWPRRDLKATAYISAPPSISKHSSRRMDWNVSLPVHGGICLIADLLDPCLSGAGSWSRLPSTIRLWAHRRGLRPSMTQTEAPRHTDGQASSCSTRLRSRRSKPGKRPIKKGGGEVDFHVGGGFSMTLPELSQFEGKRMLRKKELNEG